MDMNKGVFEKKFKGPMYNANEAPQNIKHDRCIITMQIKLDSRGRRQTQ